MIGRTVLLQLANSKRVESFVRGNRWSAKVARRYIAGESIEETTEPVRALNALGITASLDFLGESVTNEREVAFVVDTYLRLFQHIHAEGLHTNVSLKLTALGLDIDDNLCYRNMERLLSAAGPEMFVRIDMEGSPHTQRTLDLFYRLWDGSGRFRNVGVVIQSYLRRSEAEIARLIADGVRVRLCKGAYKEPPEIAFQEKREVDANYLRLMERLLREGNYPGLATHDGAIIEAAKRYARENGISSDRFEFQMLFGVRRDLQVQLKQEGYRMRVYTPFGVHWYPYMMRRLAERPANLWFAIRSMFGG